MKERLLDWLACPGCGENLKLEPRKTTIRPGWAGQWAEGEAPAGRQGNDSVEVWEGSLTCLGCGAAYPIADGVPRMLPRGAHDGPATSYAWTKFDTAIPEYERNFLDLIQPLDMGAFMGKLVLDAGCGFGRHAFFAARYGAEVVAMDSSPEACASAFENLKDLSRAHVIQGDIHHPPLRRAQFDLVFSMGVLHHLPEPRQAFAALHEMVRPGGRLSLWVYGPRQGLTRLATGALHGATNTMSPEQLHGFSRGIASGLRVFSHTPYRLLGPVPLLGAMLSHLPVHDHHKWPFDVVVADVYDRLRVPVTHYFEGEELESWYSDAGYADIAVSRRVGNTESFRASGVRR
jgi:SAM-dependent methyltransferase